MVLNTRKPDYSKASEEAKRILRENYINGPPVLAYELAENCGLTVFVDIFDDAGIAGMLDIENKMILVNKNDSLTRQSFTIAHELGHWLLHVKERDLVDKEVLYRKSLGGPDDDWMEKEANWFAANLLVPGEMLLKYEHLSQGEVATLFRVSPSVIGYRRMNHNV